MCLSHIRPNIAAVVKKRQAQLSLPLLFYTRHYCTQDMLIDANKNFPYVLFFIILL